VYNLLWFLHNWIHFLIKLIEDHGFEDIDNDYEIIVFEGDQLRAWLDRHAEDIHLDRDV
jgi:hypothetical protein